MNKILAFSAAMLLFVLLAVGTTHPTVQADSSEATSAPTSEATMVATPEVQTIDLKNGLTLIDKVSEQNIDNPKISIKVNQPVLTGGIGPTVDHFNAAVAEIVKLSADDFVMQTKQLESEATLPAEIATLGSFVEIHYVVLTANSSLISIKFNVYFYSAGAAHPNSYSVPLNYDLTANKVLALADLFKPKTKYLETLSAYATKELQKVGHLDFPDGATPIDGNYRSWNITATGIQINFDDYQVTPHAVGPQTIIVPYATLKNIIDPNGPLKAYIK